jgi:hypothetical protein
MVIKLFNLIEESSKNIPTPEKNFDSSGKMRLDVESAFYYQNGIKYPMKFEYLMFYNDGSVSLKGDDSVGQFEITGNISNGLLYLTKQYIGKHVLYYLGRLDDGDIVKFVYEFHEAKWDALKSGLESGTVMAEVKFITENFDLKNLFYKDDKLRLSYEKTDFSKSNGNKII